MLMEILTSVRRIYISFKSLINYFVYSFGRAALLLLVEVQNHTVPVRERRRIRVKWWQGCSYIRIQQPTALTVLFTSSFHNRLSRITCLADYAREWHSSVCVCVCTFSCKPELFKPRSARLYYVARGKFSKLRNYEI